MKQTPFDDAASTEHDADASLGSVMIDNRMSEYRNLVLAEWLRDLSQAIDRCPEIKEPGNDLLLQWLSALRVADLPAVMMFLFSSFAESSLVQFSSAEILRPLAAGFASALCERAPRALDATIVEAAMRHATIATERRLRAAAETASTKSSPERVWSEFVSIKEFRFRVWSTMQVCCVAVYNAYDGFLATCTNKKNGDRIEDLLKQKYGHQLYQQLFQHPDIQVARSVRHALSHNRGRLTPSLSKLNHGLHVHDDRISVFPGDIRRFVRAMGAGAIELAAFVNSCGSARNND